MKQWILRLAVGGLGLAAVTGCGPSKNTTTLPSCDTSGIACDYAGHNLPPGFNGDGKPLRESRMYYPLDLEFDPSGAAWVLDWNNHKVRKVVNGTFKTMVGNFVGDGDDAQADLTAAGADPLSCALNHPTDMQFKADGTLILDAWHNHKIRQISADGTKENVLAGRGYGFEGDGGPFAKALMSQPKSIVLAPDGALFILDQRNQRVRKVAPDAQGTITTVIGTGVTGFSGDGGDPLMAQLAFEAGPSPQPSGSLAMDSKGLLYIADSLNNRIRVVDFAANTIKTIVGTGTAGFSGDGGAATSAQINNPRDIEIAPNGNLYIADTENHAIRMVDLTTGIIKTVAGTGVAGAGTEQQEATKMTLNRPFGIGFDKAGVLYIADTFNNRIVKVTP